MMNRRRRRLPKKNLGDVDNSSKKNNNNSFVDVASEVFTENIRTDELLLSYDINALPCGRFYPSGTLFKVRPAQVREIQSYSMVG
jgi:hypothetical protein